MDAFLLGFIVTLSDQNRVRRSFTLTLNGRAFSSHGISIRQESAISQGILHKILENQVVFILEKRGDTGKVREIVKSEKGKPRKLKCTGLKTNLIIAYERQLQYVIATKSNPRKNPRKKIFCLKKHFVKKKIVRKKIVSDVVSDFQCAK